MKERKLNRFIGDKAFYAMTLSVVLPIIVQNGITNFVSLLDNLMVGSVGTAPMSGVAIINQLMFVFNLSLFGGVAGPGIFTAQYHGSGNVQGVRYTFRLKMMIAAALTVTGVLLFTLAGDPLIGLYLHEGGSGAENIADTLRYGREYLSVMVWGLLPFAVSQVYAGTLRETGETMLPMKAGLVAVFVNLGLNYVLIFGHFGAPKMGVMGAAVATVVSRYIEMLIIVVWAHMHTHVHTHFRHAYGLVPVKLAARILLRGLPLLVNEVIWSSGVAMLNQCYSVRGLDVVAGLNISSTVSNLFSVVVFSFGSTVAIVIGNQLGAGEMEKAKITLSRLITFVISLSVLIGGTMILCAPLFPKLYNTGDEVRRLAAAFIRITALFLPVSAFLNSAYFALRSGGRTVITFLFDCGFMMAGSLPVAFCLANFTDLPVIPLYFTVQLVEIVKCVIGYVLLTKGIWLNNMVEEKEPAAIEINSDPA